MNPFLLKTYYRLQRRTELPVKVVYTHRPQNYPLVYCGIPKNASSSISQALYFLDHGATTQAQREAWAHLDTQSCHHTFRTFAALEAFKFVIIRDPIQRFVSAYAHRVRELDDLKRCEAAVRAAGLERHPEPDYFVDHLNAYQRISDLLRFHTFAQNRFIFHDLKVFDAVYRLDQLSELESYIQGLNPAFEMPRKKTDGFKMTEGAFSKKSLDKLRDIYARDYRILAPYL